MMSSLTPVGERARGQRWGITAAAHVVGAMAGGALLGTLVGSVGWLLGRLGGGVTEALPVAVLAVVVVGAAVLEGGPVAVRVPTVHRQVDERWLDTYRGWVYGAGYGAQLGFGVVTIIPTWATPAMMAAMLLTRGPSAGAAIGIVYGLARSLPVLTTSRLTDPSRLWRFHRRMERWGELARPATAVGLVSVAVAVAFVALGSLTT